MTVHVQSLILDQLMHYAAKCLVRMADMHRLN